MNNLNALMFASAGWVLEMMPKAFPSWFPSAGAGITNARAVWLTVMGDVQLLIGLGFLFAVYVLPALVRAASLAPVRVAQSPRRRIPREEAGG